MKKKLAVLAALVIGVASASLWAAGPSSEVLVATSLMPAPPFSLSAPPAPAPPIEAAPGLVLSAPADFQIPRAIPSTRLGPPAGKALFDANLAIMIGLNVADYFSTKEALKYPGLEETNPLMKPFVKSPAAFAAIKIGTTALSYWSMKSVFKKNKTMAWIMTTASNVLLSYVVVNNMRLVQKARAL